MQRGLPGLAAGAAGSFPGAKLLSPCGQPSGTNLWFGAVTHDNGLATIRAEGCAFLALYAGLLCHPAQLLQLGCCTASNNKECQLQFPARTGYPYSSLWIAVDGVTNPANFKLAFGFDPRIESVAVHSNRSFELKSGVAPPLAYKLLAATNLSSRPVIWTTLLATNLTTNFPYLYYLDNSSASIRSRFYRIVPGQGRKDYVVERRLRFKN